MEFSRKFVAAPVASGWGFSMGWAHGFAGVGLVARCVPPTGSLVLGGLVVAWDPPGFSGVFGKNPGGLRDFFWNFSRKSSGLGVGKIPEKMSGGERYSRKKLGSENINGKMGEGLVGEP